MNKIKLYNSPYGKMTVPEDESEGLTGAEYAELLGPDWYDDEDDEDVFDHHPDCPACLRHLHHTQQEHEQALRRCYEASRP